MTKLILLNKPYDVLCQFTDASGRTTLKSLVDTADVYPAGRLDRDSEGLVVLTDDGKLQHYLSSPKYKLAKTYWVQVEGVPSPSALQQLRKGVLLKDGLTRPAEVKLMTPPEIWSRTPPIRQRNSIPTQWLVMTLTEGRNRQVRRMTAAVGYPTLRLIRYAVGDWTIADIATGQNHMLTAEEIAPIMVKLANDLDSKHHRRGDNRTKRSLADGGRKNKRQTHSQSTRRSSRSR